MDRTAFDLRLGTEQGRVANPAGWTAPEGAHAFVLGSDMPGRLARLVPGDNVEVFQTGNFGAGKIVRCQARIRPPSVAPPGDLRWVAELRIDGAVVTSREIGDRTRTLSDLAWCVADMAGDAHRIAFRLALLGSEEPEEEIELPAFYLDGLTLDANYAPRPMAINRYPEPNETNVPIGTTIALDVVDVGPNGVSLADTMVFVNGVLAFDGGTFEAGFDGPGSAHSAPQADTLRIVIDPTADFGSEETVTVRVVSRTTGGGSALDASYTFTTEDVLPPQVVSASSILEKSVRVVFSEPMGASALEASAYAFTRAPGAIAVTVAAVAVSKVSDNEVEVTLDKEITPAALYTVTVTGAKDVSGNTVQDPTNTATFAGYVCPRPDDREWDLFSMLPQMNRSEDNGDLAKFMAIWQEIGDLLLCNVDRFTTIVDPDFAAIEFVEAMLDDLGNPFSFALSDIDKRRLVQVLVAIYKRKGTSEGIIDAIRFFLGLEVTITVPGFAPFGLGDWELGETFILGSGNQADLYTFWINAPVTLTDEQRARITEIADYMKTAHEHFRIVEPPPPPPVLDHLELGLSELGVSWILH